MPNSLPSPSRGRFTRGLLALAVAMSLAACTGTSADPPADADPPATPSPAPEEAGPGVEPDEIRIGVTVINDFEALAAFGIEGPTAEELEAAVTAVTDAINDRGGVAGRRLVPTFLRVDQFTSTAFASQAQAVCESFTVDNEVFAVVMITKNMSTQLPMCLAERGTILIDGANGMLMDAAQLGGAREHYYRPTDLLLDEYDAYLDALEASGFLAADNVVGVLRYDTSAHERTLTTVIQPALERLGIAPPEDYAFTFPGNTDSHDDTSAESLSAVIRLRDAGVDRILFIGSQGDIPFLFIPTAESQEFRPRYGFSSHDAPRILGTTQPAAQMEGAMLASWSWADFGVDPDPASAAWDDCVAIMRDAALDEQGFSCDPFFFLEAALSRAESLTAAGMRAAVNELADAVVLAEPYETRFGPGRASGIGAVTVADFDESCSCFVASAAPTPLASR